MIKNIKWGKLDHDVWPVPTADEKKRFLRALEKTKKLNIFDYHEKEGRFVIIDD